MSILCTNNVVHQLDTTTWEAITLRDDFEARMIVQLVYRLSLHTPVLLFTTHKEIYDKVTNDFT